MKKIMTIHNVNSIHILKKADGFIIGNNEFGTRLTKSFEIFEINYLIEMGMKLNKEIFLQANQMMDDDKINEFRQFLQKIDVINLAGVFVADLGAGEVLLELGFENKAIYHPETLLTNSFDFNYMFESKYYGAFVAKEITLDDVLEIGRLKKYHLFMMGHGYLSMFYSRRHLIENYETYLDQKLDLKYQDNIRLKEKRRKDEVFPILEDDAGTHVFRSKEYSTLRVLEKLEEVVDYLVIDTIFKDDLYGEVLINYYQGEYDDNYEDNLDSYDDGFLFTKTYYKRGEEND